MSRAVYRGVAYDTEKRLEYQKQMMQQPQQSPRIYRGVVITQTDEDKDTHVD